MITKKQALEFIYNISQYSRKVNLIMLSGVLKVDYFKGTLGYDYISYGEPHSLEDMVKQFIIENDGAQILRELNEIPVDIDMLEVGQTYKVEFLDVTGMPNSFTETLLSVTEEDKPVFNFSNGYYTKYIDIKEIYKVVK